MFCIRRSKKWHSHIAGIVSFTLLLVSKTACMAATDPGMDLRYDITFDSASVLAGKKFHWASMPVNIQYSACAVTGYSANIESSVLRGIDFWQNNAAVFGEIQTQFSSSGDIAVAYKVSPGGNIIASCGATVGQYTSGGYVLMRPLTLTIYTNFSGFTVTDAQYEFVSAHEMGHCLGLWSHSPQEGDLMYAYLTNNIAYSARDVNTLRYLYSQASTVGSYPPQSASNLSSDIKVVGTIESIPLMIH